MKKIVLLISLLSTSFIGVCSNSYNLSKKESDDFNKGLSLNDQEIEDLNIDYSFNFGPTNTPEVTGFITDTGLLFGQKESLEYGWILSSNSTSANLSNSASLREPNYAIDYLRASLININSLGVNPDVKWELVVPNGTYRVVVQAGDIAKELVSGTRHQINVEGTTVLDFQSFETTGTKTSVAQVFISDGRLTIDSPNGFNTKINSVVIQSLDVLNAPAVIGSIPTDGETNVDINTSVSGNFLSLPNVNNVGLSSLDNTTITNETVKLFKIENNAAVAVEITVNGTGGGDAINISANGALEANTKYLYSINGVKDVAGATVFPYTAEFTTGDSDDSDDLDNVEFENIGEVASGSFSTVTIGPDEKLYGLMITGEIRRWNIAEDGTLTDMEILDGLQDTYGEFRLAIGLVFSPNSTATNLEAYISHSSFVFNDGPEYDGVLSKLTGDDLENEQQILTGLPRSVRDHLTNSIIFDPSNSNVLLFNQGSNTAGGEADDAWGGRPERLLSAATLRLDLGLLPTQLPMDVRTSEDISVINNAPSNSITMSDGFYNPYATNAPLTIFASGIRNAYDLVWHTNGYVYVPTNGTAGGSNSPASVIGTRRPDGTTYNGPEIPAVIGNNTQKDFLFKIDPNSSVGYYGNPNPLRGEYVLNSGYESTTTYPSDIVADANYRGFAFDFDYNKSPNGVIEYQTEGPLKGAIIVCRYSGGSDLIVLFPDGPNGDVETSKIGVTGFTGLSDPLDLIEDTKTGNIYVSDFARGRIELLKLVDTDGLNVKFENIANGDSFSPGETIGVVVSANSTEAAVSNVQLYLDGTLVRQDDSAPYEWGSSSEIGDAVFDNLAIGTYTLLARATDALGTVVEKQISIAVKDPSSETELSFIFSAEGGIFELDEEVGVEVTVNDNDITVSNIQLFIEGILVRQESIAPYEWGVSNGAGVDPSLQNLEEGSYELLAVATDSDGNTHQSTVEIIIGNQITAGITFVTPVEGDVFSNLDSVGVEVAALSADLTISNIRLFLNGSLVRQENIAPYEWGISNGLGMDSSLENLEEGLYELLAVATDTDGNTYQTSIEITVGNQITTGITFVTPAEGDVFSNLDSIGVEVTSLSTDTAISNIQLYLNDTLIRQESIAPYEWGANNGVGVDPSLENVAIGVYELKAVATSSTGEVFEESIQVSVINATNSAKSLINDANSIQALDQTIAVEGLDITTYPNPVENILYFNFSNKPENLVNVQISNISCELILNTDLTVDALTAQIDLSNLDSGIYLLKIKTALNEDSIHKKIIKE